MPNYQLVATSMFEPYSYERYLQPLAAYTGAYKELEDALADLQTKANVWENMANELTDPETYAKYKRYSDDLKTQADTLASQGLTPTSRRDMLNLRSRYSAEITPIEEAYNRRAEILKFQRELYAKDPSLIFERDLLNDPESSSLDRFVGNSGYDYGKLYSGDKLRLDVGKAASNLAKTLREDNKSGEELRAQLKRVLPYQYRLLEQRGFSTDEVLGAIANDPNGSEILKSIIEGTIDASGMREWASEDNLNRARAYAAEGLWEAIGEPAEKWLTDTYSMQMAKAAPTGGGGNDGQSLYRYPFDYGSIETEDNINKISKNLGSLYVNTTSGSKAFDTRFLGPNKNINPMRLYDYYQQWVDTHPEYEPEPIRGIENIRSAEEAKNVQAHYQEAIDRRDAAFKKETGVDVKDIISTAQYEALEDAGYTANDSANKFINSSLENDLEDLIRVYRPSRLPLAKFDTPNLEYVLNKLSEEAISSNESIMKDYSTGKFVKPKNVVDKDTKIVGVSYDLRSPSDAIVSLKDKKGNVKRYAINVAVLDPSLTRVFEGIAQDEKITVRGKEMPKYMRDGESYTRRQNVGVETLRAWIDDFLPNLSETTSTRRP